MSLKSAIRDHFIRKELAKAEEKQPMIRKVLAWLTDPEAQFRKRNIALVCALLSGACRGIDATLASACAAATVVGGWCQVNPGAWATVIDVVNGAVQIIQPGMDLATVAFGIAGYLHAWQKSKPATIPAGLYGSRAEVQAQLDRLAGPGRLVMR